MIDKALILNNIKNHYKFKKDIDFASFLGIKPQTLATWYSRNVYDVHILYEKCNEIKSDYLLTGKGEMLRLSHEKNTTTEGNTLQKDKFIEVLEQSNKLLLEKVSSLENNYNLNERVKKLEEFKEAASLKFKVEFEIQESEAALLEQETDKLKLVQRKKG